MVLKSSIAATFATDYLLSLLGRINYFCLNWMPSGSISERPTKMSSLELAKTIDEYCGTVFTSFGSHSFFAPPMLMALQQTAFPSREGLMKL